MITQQTFTPETFGKEWVPMNVLLLGNKRDVCQKHGGARTTYYLGVPKVWEDGARNQIPVQWRKAQRN